MVMVEGILPQFCITQGQRGRLRKSVFQVWAGPGSYIAELAPCGRGCAGVMADQYPGVACGLSPFIDGGEPRHHIVLESLLCTAPNRMLPDIDKLLASCRWRTEKFRHTAGGSRGAAPKRVAVIGAKAGRDKGATWKVRTAAKGGRWPTAEVRSCY